MSPRIKLLGPVFAAICLLVGGIGRRCAWIFIGPVLTKLAQHGILHGDPATLYHSNIVLAASWIVVIGVILVCCNATNLMDGLDGLCGGVTGVVALGVLFLVVNLPMQSGAININHDALSVVMGLALLGA